VTCLYIGHPHDTFVAHQVYRGALSSRVVLLRIGDHPHDNSHIVSRKIVVRHFGSEPAIKTFNECNEFERKAITENSKKQKERCTIY